MRNLLLLPLAVALLGGCAAADVLSQTVEGSGVSAVRTERADGVRRVALGAPGTLVVEVGRASDLRIEGDDNLVERLVVERENGTLRIRTPRNTNFDPALPLRYHVGVAALEGVSVAGSGRVEADGGSGGTFEVEVAGSGDAVVSGVRADAVALSRAGSGDAAVGGATGAVSVDIAGSGNADAGRLAARSATVSIAGSGDVTLRVSDRLDVEIAGSGDVRYYGDPEVHRAVAGSGDVERAGD
jgi:hypothetical protein